MKIKINHEVKLTRDPKLTRGQKPFDPFTLPLDHYEQLCYLMTIHFNQLSAIKQRR